MHENTTLQRKTRRAWPTQIQLYARDNVSVTAVASVVTKFVDVNVMPLRNR